MAKIREGSVFKYGKLSGTVVERLPPDYWDHRGDPEWIVKYDITCGGDTKCEPESKLRKFEVSQPV